VQQDERQDHHADHDRDRLAGAADQVLAHEADFT
jgi:hypothetical protein